MADQTSGTNEALENKEAVDPWAAAFAALEPKAEEDGQANPNDGANAGNGAADNADTGAAGGQEVPNQDEAANGNAPEGAVGGLDTGDGGTDQAVGNAFTSVLGFSEEQYQQYEKDFDEWVKDKTITDIAAEFVKRGYENDNGKLGITIDNPKVCKRDKDGVPHFYNFETGQEFRGENPRRQAQELCDDYNRALADAFNQACTQYEAHLRQQSEPSMAVRRFAPKYEKLDDIRRGMFDNFIEDYEIKDDEGKVIGYECDLDKALALVDRQIATIQNYAKARQQQQPAPAQPAGPALDMKTSSGAIASGDVKITSLEQALEFEQNKLLEKLNRK